MIKRTVLHTPQEHDSSHMQLVHSDCGGIQVSCADFIPQWVQNLTSYSMNDNIAIAADELRLRW